MRKNDWAAARETSQLVLVQHAEDPDILTEVAMVSGKSGLHADAAELLCLAASAAKFEPSSRVDFAFQACLEAGHLYEALELLEDSVKQHPDRSEHRRILVGLLAEAQRHDRIPKHLVRLIHDRNFDLHLLLAVSDPSTRHLSLDVTRQMLQRNPGDQRIRLADACEKLNRRDAKAATKILAEVTDQHRDFAIASAMQALALAADARWAEFTRWHEKDRLPSSEEHVEYWIAVGKYCEADGKISQSVRAYWEACQRDVTNPIAWESLARAIQHLAIEQPDSVTRESVEQVNQFAKNVYLFRERLEQFRRSDQRSQSRATDIAEALFRIGQTWKAEAWSAVATRLPDEPTDRLPGLRYDIVEALKRDRSWITKEVSLQSIDLSSLPAPSLSNDSRSQRIDKKLVVPLRSGTAHLRLRDETEVWGLTGMGANPLPAGPDSQAIIRFAGAGCGVLDFDLDGRPDLVVMRAGGTMKQNDSAANQLLRNVHDRFETAPDLAGHGDTGFGQGVAVGDYNEDGFPDLFYSNLGKNRLLRNNGDGTFSDAEAHLPVTSADAWSTSSAFADLNADGITDLMVTNYCRADAGIDKACRGESGESGPCFPLKFPGSPDQIFGGTSTARFVDQTDSWIGEQPVGRGLGILAGAIDGTRTSVLIANDMTRNAFFSAADRPPFRLVESALARGVAVDGRSMPQASMGMAASDFDRDGDLDLYVTGFGGEYNVMYEQTSPGLWIDVSAQLNLVQPTLSMVGFGTEATDLDGDGIDELLVTNGHIGEFPGTDPLPYEQPFQLFRRSMTGTFQLVSMNGWDEYFRNAHVGRALVKLDANSDGRDDLVVTHASEPLRLLTNRGRDQYRRVGFRLTGTTCSRDAIGAIVRFRADGIQRSLWLLSGDGYLCSNERVLRTGVGEATSIEDVSVTWPDGVIDHIDSLPTDQEYLLVQGADQAHRLRDYRLEDRSR